jgi:hypothetical protein
MKVISRPLILITYFTHTPESAKINVSVTFMFGMIEFYVMAKTLE